MSQLLYKIGLVTLFIAIIAFLALVVFKPKPQLENSIWQHEDISAYVIEFKEDTPYELIKMIEPDVLVKGGDWQPEQIVGADIVLKNGGVVKSLPFIDGYSTTKIETKIKNS